MTDVCGKVSKGGGVTCDRERWHHGHHRGYMEEVDEVVFWLDISDLWEAPARMEARLETLTEVRTLLETRLTALANAQPQRRDWVLIALGRALLAIDELLEGTMEQGE